MIELSGYIEDNGKPHIYHREKINQWFKENAGKRFVLKIERKKKKRSNLQNAYWWGVVVPIVTEALEHLGHECSKEDTHEMLKAKFNYKEIINEDTGEVLQMPFSTTELSTIDFMVLIEKVQRFAAEFLNTVIPDPNSSITIDFK